MLNQPADRSREVIAGVIRLAILLVLAVWAFWHEMASMVSASYRTSEMAHALVAPLAILLLIYLRRRDLANSMTKGSTWGILLLLIGAAQYAAATWPFSYGYIRDVAVIPVLAGLVLVTCGWRVLKLSIPMLILVALSVPIGSRLWATLIIRPETYTISATAKTLDTLPGVDTSISGTDMFFSGKHGSGAIALGESNRGARLLLASVALGVFVVFSRVRSPGRVIFAAAATIPIVLACNFIRLTCWGLIVIYTGLGPPSTLPRSLSAVSSLVVAYILFALICAVKLNFFVDADEDEEDEKDEELAHAHK